MRTARRRIFVLNLGKAGTLRLVRAIAGVLAVVLMGKGVAMAAGGPSDPVKLKQKLTARGIGNRMKVTELDGTTVTGSLTAIADDSLQATPMKATTKVTISYAQVRKVGNGGMSGGTITLIVVGCVVVAVGIAAIVIAEDIKHSPI